MHIIKIKILNFYSDITMIQIAFTYVTLTDIQTLYESAQTNYQELNKSGIDNIKCIFFLSMEKYHEISALQ